MIEDGIEEATDIKLHNQAGRFPCVLESMPIESHPLKVTACKSFCPSDSGSRFWMYAPILSSCIAMQFFSKLEKTLFMKFLLLLFVSCFLLFKSNAQDNKYTVPKIQPEKPYQYKLPKELDATILPDSVITLRDLALLKSKKPGVYRLPQDNMPCIVPDSTKTVQIPNAWRGPVRVPYQGKKPRIPNKPTMKWVPAPIASTDGNAR